MAGGVFVDRCVEIVGRKQIQSIRLSYSAKHKSKYALGNRDIIHKS